MRNDAPHRPPHLLAIPLRALAKRNKLLLLTTNTDWGTLKEQGDLAREATLAHDSEPQVTAWLFRHMQQRRGPSSC